jgi:hypothetical protein
MEAIFVSLGFFAWKVRESEKNYNNFTSWTLLRDQLREQNAGGLVLRPMRPLALFGTVKDAFASPTTFVVRELPLARRTGGL